MIKTAFPSLILIFFFAVVSCNEEPDEPNPIVVEKEDTWVSKANFPLDDLSDGVSFSIGSKLYVGTGFYFLGYNSGYSNDFYAYDKVQDSWEEIAELPSHERESAIAFSIGSFGYVGLGKDCLGMGICDHHYFNDLWRYNPATDEWTEMAEFPGTPRAFSTAFVIGDKAYVTGGSTYGDNDMWEYNSSSNEWKKKTSYPGNCSSRAISFSLDGRGYVGFGWSGFTCKDFWEYDQVTDNWRSLEEFPGDPRYSAIAFSMGDIGYLMCGFNQGTQEYFRLSDVWKFDVKTEKWTQIDTSYPGKGHVGLVGGVIEDEIYLGLGNKDPFSRFPYILNEFWQYNP